MKIALQLGLLPGDSVADKISWAADHNVDGIEISAWIYGVDQIPQALKDFEKKYKQYNVKCTITTFEDTTEALGKIRSGGVQADIFNPSYDQMGKLPPARSSIWRLRSTARRRTHRWP